MQPRPENPAQNALLPDDIKTASSGEVPGNPRSTLLDPETLQRDFDALAADLKEFIGGREAVFIPNPGNYGDGLIFTGAQRFLEAYNISCRFIHISSRVEKIHLAAVALADLRAKNKVFIYGGSGAWSKVCDLGFRNVSRLGRLTDKIFVLPTTFELFNVKRAVKLYRRDNDESLINVPDSQFCHDMAFFLALLPPDKLLPNRTAPTKKIGLILRTDNEARFDRLIPDNIENFDVSASGDYNDPAESFLRYIDQFEHIVTDRLHAAIGGVLLGKRVSLLQNNYWKIRAIYRASIQDIFSDAEMISDSGLLALLADARSG